MHIQIVIGSVRLGRIGPQIAQWVNEVVSRKYSCELVDLKDWILPMDDEPNLPAEGGYLSAHTLSWSEKISEADAYIFVFPQYNWGYPAALKNAIDHLYTEWSCKPVTMVSYANRGGGKASLQLRQVLQGLHMKVTETNVEIKLSEVDFSTPVVNEAYPVSLNTYEGSLIEALNQMAELNNSAKIC
ncbi:NAD(P)H-dependent oxidoreductase [Xenorhabdus nematophila]|uniref:SPCC4B3.06c protein n=1 Tax=Xenorhabdus nematophila (strain ATCC 19061 / DSM 3370 / CCUG 14189 / LMG 1036 / NCIMB 9965 / AN6) TaxID=406817 RepID=D3VI49_XENNA|nr:NAD(P)H-dependent oxidoreductase [Xenorhabdus nematophila]CEE95452.1 SPCC4B3.06c protein [Xenorhabdus nematophila str. Anatoliense]CEF29725.1 SPCC4B3.06c protein [Xenorhabdus nematophila str. Websteri]AYA40003.1 NAD(P)H-dependent oxidoreductase [Xenorhabdus nematophila]KHD28226.1 NAD(FAD)-dependent dehydrogenase [Xenorhabdus nematophila]MBA0018642.1 NAD(P)H-dependent oxidoreductase [Xenorhabdus nematophila]